MLAVSLMSDKVIVSLQLSKSNYTVCNEQLITHPKIQCLLPGSLSSVDP